MPSTPLQEIYDAFFIRSGKDWFGKEDQVFQFFKTACGKSYKTVRNSLDYILYENELESYDGEMIAKLDQDEIDLIAMFMHLESLNKQKSALDLTKQYIGTKDFNKLPNKEVEYKNLLQSIKDLREEIYSFRQEFYTYKN